ncbi:MAG: hypothetical protein EZS28_045284, partial [Streblomastix strix]
KRIQSPQGRVSPSLSKVKHSLNIIGPSVIEQLSRVSLANGVGVRNDRQKATLSAFVTGCGCNVGSILHVYQICSDKLNCYFYQALALAAASVIAEISAFAYAASDETDIDVSFVYVDTILGFNIRNLTCYVTTTVING